MGKLPTDDGNRAVRLLREVAESMAGRSHAGAPLTDARLLRELASRLLDSKDPWQALALEALARALDDGTVVSQSGALALAEMLRELEKETSRG